MGLGRGGLGLTGSSGSSGRVTTAFLAFSSLAPSSVDPLSPQRTFKTKGNIAVWHTGPRRTDTRSVGSWLNTSESKDEYVT